MKLSEALGQPLTVQGVIDRMALRIQDPSSKDAFRSGNLCHSVSADYMAKHGKPTDSLVLLGQGNMVTHSIVVDRGDRILADSFSRQRPSFDGDFYSFGGHTYRVIKKIPLSAFM